MVSKEKDYVWIFAHKKGANTNKKETAEMHKTLLEQNTQEIFAITNYVLLLFTITAAIYVVFQTMGVGSICYVLLLVVTFVVSVLLYLRIRRIERRNKLLLESYMTIQTSLAGGRLWLLEGTDEGITKSMKMLRKKGAKIKRI